MMNYWEIQSTAVALLQARAEFSSVASTGILSDDGSYPKTPGLETALATSGLALVVTEPISTIQGDVALSGTTYETIQIAVIIRHREGVAGTTFTHWHALKAVRQALQGAPSTEPNPHLRFQPDSPPWTYDGNLGGDNRIAVNFTVGHILTP